MSDSTGNPELDAVDADIRAYYTADLDARYIPTLPILIQISRQLRQLEERVATQQPVDGTEVKLCRPRTPAECIRVILIGRKLLPKERYQALLAEFNAVEIGGLA